jgi:hypothetical protein
MQPMILEKTGVFSFPDVWGIGIPKIPQSYYNEFALKSTTEDVNFLSCLVQGR